MRAHIEKQSKNATADLTPTTHGAIMQLGRTVRVAAHEPYMDS
jgi:hypothetical protein